MARYRDAIEWLAFNDDNDWIDDPDGHLSVTASMVVDLFGKDAATVKADIEAEIARESRREQRSRGSMQ